MLVQETHTDEKNETDWIVEWEGEICLSSLSSNSGGVAILFSKSFSPISYDFQVTEEGRILIVKAKYEKYTAVFINIYAPVVGQDRVRVLSTLNDFTETCNSDDYLYLGGDFNGTQNDRFDRNHVEPHRQSQRVLSSLIETHDLVDLWRELHDTERQYRP